MFSWFRKKPVEPPSIDRVWITERARTSAVIRTVQESPTLLLTFFDETHERVAASLDQAGIEYAAATRATWGPRVHLGSAFRLEDLPDQLPGNVGVCFVERYPLPDVNKEVLEILALRTRAMPVFHTSLDEPSMQVFDGNRIAHMMRQMGVTEDEPIESRILSRSLANSRTKIAARVKSPVQPARSMFEWFQLNLSPKD